MEQRIFPNDIVQSRVQMNRTDLLRHHMPSVEKSFVSQLALRLQKEVDNFLESNKSLPRPFNLFETTMEARIEGRFYQAKLSVSVFYKQGNVAPYFEYTFLGPEPNQAPDVITAFKELSEILADAEPVIHSAEVTYLDKSLDSGDELFIAAHHLWCELFGIDPASNPIDPEFNLLHFKVAELSKTLLPYLSKGKDGVRYWNALSQDERRLVDIRDLDLRGQSLSEVLLSLGQIQNCNFDNASLKKAKFQHTEICNSSFVSADLQKANMVGIEAHDVSFSRADLRQSVLTVAKLEAVNFEQANLSGATMSDCDLRNANLVSVNLSAAKLDGANLCGADLSGCDVSETIVDKATFDEHSVFPPDLVQWPKMKWVGNGTNPFKAAGNKSVPFGDLDFEGMIKNLNIRLDKTRVKNALSMLKKDVFQLYHETSDEGVAGIVKSQTDPDLLYACHISSEGQFACCTQNSRPCGGLKGAVCKHIVVLLCGLVQADLMDATTATKWVFASSLNDPSKEKTLMVDIFLRYKDAQAGEIDWRPIETIPEDYYAF